MLGIGKHNIGISGISSYVPGGSLLPQVPRLRYQFCADLLKNYGKLAMNFEQLRRTTANLEILPYSLGAASLAIFDLARDQIAIVNAKAAVEKPGTISELSEAQRNLLGYRLDSFLDAARRAQNAIVPYLRRTVPSLNPAKSLADVVKSLMKGTLALPEPFKSDTLNYWNTYGAKLKSYRDLGQHYMIVGTPPKVFVPHKGVPALLFCLPNNPDDRPISDLRYDNPQVHVQQFVLEHFENLLTFCFAILEQLLDPQIDAALMPGIEGRTPLTRIGSGTGPEAYIPVTVGDLENIVQDALKKLHARFDGKRTMPNKTRS